MCLDAQSRENRCTVYGDRSGEVWADGLFALRNLNFGVSASELKFAAYGRGTIYLEDAKMLVHVAPGKRDPSRLRITRTLETLAMKGSSGAIDCGRGEAQSTLFLLAAFKHSKRNGHSISATTNRVPNRSITREWLQTRQATLMKWITAALGSRIELSYQKDGNRSMITVQK